MSTAGPFSEFTLCSPCAEYVTSSDVKVYNDPMNCWPAFTYYLLTSHEMRDEYDLQYLWGFIPAKW
jgi:hypothetical protein